MNKKELEKLNNQEHRATSMYIHTAEILTDKIVDFDFNESTKNTSYIKKNGLTQYRTIFNANKYSLNELEAYNDFEHVTDELLYTLNDIKDAKFQRVDLAFNFYDDYAFQNYFKINNYLLHLLAYKYKVKNSYTTAKFKTDEKHSISSKNKYFQIEFYNKYYESDGKSNVNARLEFRKLEMDKLADNNPRSLQMFWCALLKDLPNYHDEMIEDLNNDLVKRFNQCKSNKYIRKTREWHDAKSFISRYGMFIFTSKQLEDLYIKLGVEKPKSKATTYNRYHREFDYITLNDYIKYTRTIKKTMENYFKK